MKYKGIIFDLDGVLCSTDRFHFEAWKQTAEEVGAPFDETINMKLRGVSRMESLEIILSGSSKTFTDAEKERLATEKNDRYRKLLAQMSPADMPTAVRDALTALHNAGLKLAVGSSSKNAAYILERLDANRYFDAVCDGTMIAHSRARKNTDSLPFSNCDQAVYRLYPQRQHFTDNFTFHWIRWCLFQWIILSLNFLIAVGKTSNSIQRMSK